MKIYLAAPYAARETAAKYADELTRIGYTVTSTWLDGTHEIDAGSLGAAPAFTDSDAANWASSDLYDIDKADLLVALTSNGLGIAPPAGTSGGRHVETGYAIAKGKPVIVVGEPENIFHRLGRACTVVPNWHEAVIELAARLVEDRRPRAVVR